MSFGELRGLEQVWRHSPSVRRQSFATGLAKYSAEKKNDTFIEEYFGVFGAFFTITIFFDFLIRDEEYYSAVFLKKKNSESLLRRQKL